MIRKQTWILLVIFAVLAGLAFYLQKNPIQNPANITPSPTSQTSMIEGWSSTEINRIDYQDDQGNNLVLEQLANGGWVLQPENSPVDLGKIEAIRTQILDTTNLATLESGISLDAVGLVKPARTITIYGAEGKQSVVKVGNLTPTESGYYVIVDHKSPTIASRYAIDAIFDSFMKERLFDYTPTPMSLVTPEETPEP